VTVIVRVSVWAKPLSPSQVNTSAPLSVATGLEGDVGVGRDRRIQLGAEHQLAAVAAAEAVDDVPGQHLPLRAGAMARLHGVRDQHADLDDVAALRAGRGVDQRARHLTIPRCSRPA
jgi:hypothetical protein